MGGCVEGAGLRIRRITGKIREAIVVGGFFGLLAVGIVFF